MAKLSLDRVLAAFDRSVSPLFGQTDIRTLNMRANFSTALETDECPHHDGQPRSDCDRCHENDDISEDR